ncbi:hypothetical protein [uncultured Campylobacter sp.]|uniref:hypothetical protein n=1 Tax=uncultured Campylobacter sp. TaxID=218934 RepID=UPI0026328F3D|nr:hypothetical protein [uncultured Campylobacter sp.]
MLSNFNMSQSSFRHIYKEIRDKGYICSPQRVFMCNLNREFGELCKKYELDDVDIMIIGDFFPCSPNADSYLIFNTNMIAYEKAVKILERCVKNDSFFNFI